MGRSSSTGGSPCSLGPDFTASRLDQFAAAAWSPDGKRIVTASYVKTARVWNADGTGIPIVLKCHGAGVTSRP